ncbi:MAG: helix-turn-helix domain-containing protein [Lachnospiraceae bacterium]|nr:helix-turn-helix domain-containing protein [Lachnospiraceae bacterium]
MKNIISGNIARYRKESGITQEELASRLNITYQAVSKWETGQSLPDITALPKLAQIFNISVDQLLGFNAGNASISYYENVYNNSDYYWGVNPSAMCLKILALKPPEKRIKILDIACGEGKDAVFFARCGYDVDAFDITVKGIDKTKRLADKARVNVNVFKANISDYRLDKKYDILYSSGALHYIKPELRSEIIADYRKHTAEDGLNVFNVFINKPFIASPPEDEKYSYFWQSGELLTHYHDWFIEDFSEIIFDCNSSGIGHQHAMNVMYAKKMSLLNTRSGD